MSSDSQIYLGILHRDLNVASSANVLTIDRHRQRAVADHLEGVGPAYTDLRMRDMGSGSHAPPSLDLGSTIQVQVDQISSTVAGVSTRSYVQIAAPRSIHDIGNA